MIEQLNNRWFNSYLNKADYWDIRFEEKIATKWSSKKKVNFKKTRGLFMRVQISSSWYIFSTDSAEKLILFLKGIAKNDVAFRKAKYHGFKKSTALVVSEKTDLSFGQKLHFKIAENLSAIENQSKSLGFQSLLSCDYNRTKKIFKNSEGSKIEFTDHDFYMGVNISIEKGDDFKIPFFYGSKLMDEKIFQLEINEAIRKYSSYISLNLGNRSTISSFDEKTLFLLAPSVASLFIHEILGHAMEADVQLAFPRLQEIFSKGRKITDLKVSIVDENVDKSMRGFIPCDDEGIYTEKSYLLYNGIVQGRLHTRETAAIFNEDLTGNGRAIDYRYPPICRMRNTILRGENIDSSNPISTIKKGVFIDFPYGGKPDFNKLSFEINALMCRRIENGKLSESLGPLKLKGKIPDSFTSIVETYGAEQSDASSKGCGKSGQRYLPVGSASPYLLIRDLTVEPFLFKTL